MKIFSLLYLIYGLLLVSVGIMTYNRITNIKDSSSLASQIKQLEETANENP